MTSPTTLQDAAASYTEMLARYAQYADEVPLLRAVRATRRMEGKGGVKFEAGDETLGYYRANIISFGGDWIVYSPRVGWHVGTSLGGFEYMGEAA